VSNNSPQIGRGTVGDIMKYTDQDAV
jgi:hypothetical protein